MNKLFIGFQKLAEDDLGRLRGFFDGSRLSVHDACNLAIRVMSSKPRLALNAFRVIASSPCPSELDMRAEWLKAHNNAVYLSVLHGTDDECRTVTEQALAQGEANPAIFHNAACALCRIGDSRGALAALRRGVATGYDAATSKMIREDHDLALIRESDEFQSLFPADSATVLPKWAEGWPAACFIQFREAFATGFRDPDLSFFDDGIVISEGKHYDVRAVAMRCKGASPARCFEIADEHLQQIHRSMIGSSS